MKYLPFLKGKYTVNPGLKAVWKAEGMDGKIFQFDENFKSYLSNKKICRQERISKYYCEHELDSRTQNLVNDYIIQQLLIEYPEFFNFNKSTRQFNCSITRDTIELNDDGTANFPSAYISLFDALSSQVQEDLAIFKFTESTDWLSAVHLCAPNYWSAEEKIGLDFNLVHEPVPGMEKMRKHYHPMLRSVMEKGPYYRFGWGITTDNKLNHHPDAPAGVDEKEWGGRRFDPWHPSLYVRVERQTLTGFPEVAAILFTIKTYLYDVTNFSRIEKSALCAAIESMPKEALIYKGLDRDKDSILNFLRN